VLPTGAAWPGGHGLPADNPLSRSIQRRSAYRHGNWPQFPGARPRQAKTPRRCAGSFLRPTTEGVGEKRSVQLRPAEAPLSARVRAPPEPSSQERPVMAEPRFRRRPPSSTRAGDAIETNIPVDRQSASPAFATLRSTSGVDRVVAQKRRVTSSSSSPSWPSLPSSLSSPCCPPSS